MFVAAVLAGLCWGWVRQGRLTNLAGVQVRYAACILAFGVMQVLLAILQAQSRLPVGGMWDWGFVASTLLLAGVLAANYARPGFVWMAIGTMMNAVAMLGHGGRMPVSVQALHGAGLDGYALALAGGGAGSKHVLVDGIVRISDIFGDVFYLPPQTAIPRVLSLGDVLLIAGLFLFISRQMTRTIERAGHESAT